jgi:hypothetical protein
VNGVRRRGWWVLAIFAVTLVVFGVGDVLGGVLADPAITQTLAGRTAAEISAAEPTAYRLYDFVTRSGGANLVLIGILLSMIVAIPYRGGQRWAWWAMWILPAWAALVPVQFLLFGTAAGQPPAPPMVSGPLVAVIAAGVLLIDRRRFTGAPEMGATPAIASGTRPVADRHLAAD